VDLADPIFENQELLKFFGVGKHEIVNLFVMSARLLIQGHYKKQQFLENKFERQHV